LLYLKQLSPVNGKKEITMKTFTKIVMVAGLTFGAMATAQANSQFVAADDAITVDWHPNGATHLRANGAT
jgi:hypothetical protein